MTPKPTPVAWNGARVRGLTLIRPWDRALLLGPKDVENRPRRWHLPAEGIVVAIHAGYAWDQHGWDTIRRRWPEAAALAAPFVARRGRRPESAEAPDGAFPAGAIMGLCWMGPPIPVAACASAWRSGPWCYPVGARVVLPKPIPWPGMLGLWRVPGPLEEELVRAWVAAGHQAPVLPVTPPTADDGGDLFEGL